MSETKLKKQVIDFIRRMYPSAWFYKAADRWTAGIPDLVLCVEGRFYAIELKVSDNKTTPIQEFVIRKIQGAGGRAAVCRSLDEVKQFLKGGDSCGVSWQPSYRGNRSCDWNSINNSSDRPRD